MNSEKINSRILFVSTYPELTEMAYHFSYELNSPISIYEGGIMNDAHIYAKKMEKNLSVIISQGGTAAAIKSLVHIPVISIEITVGDFLKALLEASRFGDPIALISYKTNELHELEDLKKIFNNNIEYKVYSYSNKNEFKQQVENAISAGKCTLVGMGSCIYESAKEKGLNFVLIKSSERAVRQAIISAKNIIDLSKNEKTKVERLKAIIDHSQEGIIFLNKNGVVTTFNPTAEKFFNIKSDVVMNRPIHNLPMKNSFQDLYGNGDYEVNKLIKINNIPIIINRIPILVENEKEGTVITFRQMSEIEKIEQNARMQLHAKGLTAKYTFDDIIGKSPLIKETVHKALKFSKSSATILIEGETGTGKELFAHSIHNASSRREGPFVAINCAALPENLLESELFGYEEGAFTGAKKGGKPGLFELAHNGTIFLDEIGEISLSMQSRLLRVLQEKEVLRIGGNRIFNVNIRIIAATNKNLYKMVKEGKFREDLYFRINLLNLKIPPLCERKEDIPELVQHFIHSCNKIYGTNVKTISKKGMDLLKEYPWPGNVRELENFIEKLIILTETPIVDDKFIKYMLEEHATCKYYNFEHSNNEIISIKLGSLKNIELQIIDILYKKYNGNKTLISQILGISRTTIWKLLKELQQRINKD